MDSRATGIAQARAALLAVQAEMDAHVEDGPEKYIGADVDYEIRYEMLRMAEHDAQRRIDVEIDLALAEGYDDRSVR